ncbi:sensor histidine kinase PirS [Maricurvus nonylphenolicus]|uniref:ATP-binding protein n=1 Tax=Maricurvus nonylphenolicus TaxID=1008307 RepID=UPI0036F23FDE
MKVSNFPFKGIPLGLFGKLYIIIAVSSIALIWLVMVLSEFMEKKFSTITQEHQQELMLYAQQAEKLVQAGDVDALTLWADNITQLEDTWLGVIKPNPDWMVGEPDYEFIGGEENLIIGRNIEWPIHLYHNYNPIMKMTLGDTGYNLMIQLPQRMRPGAYWGVLSKLITMGLPILLVAALSYIIFRHIISPLKQLQQATQRFSNGDYQVRTAETLSKRKDELSELAMSFDQMADRIGNLLTTQRQLIQDISHELRTPITRIKLVLSKPNAAEVISRVEQEVNAMQSLMEDTLTLSWLDTERPTLNQEQVDVSLLLETIVEDARFEFPEHQLALSTPETCVVNNSSHRALGQALENMIRNALKYSPKGSQVEVAVKTEQTERLCITIKDEGPGVPEQDIDNIFKPFYRGDKSRQKGSGKDPGGYGLGLALSKRQITAVGGEVSAANLKPNGLCMTTCLPMQAMVEDA